MPDNDVDKIIDEINYKNEIDQINDNIENLTIIISDHIQNLETEKEKELISLEESTLEETILYYSEYTAVRQDDIFNVIRDGFIIIIVVVVVVSMVKIFFRGATKW